MKKKIVLTLLISLFLMVSCREQVPDEMLPPASETYAKPESVVESAEETVSAIEAATETEPVTEAATETEPVTEAATAAPETEAKAEVPEDDTFPFHQDRIQIGIFMEPGKNHNDTAHYDQLKEAGITYVQMTNPDIYRNEKALESMMKLCDSYKIAVFVNTNGKIQTTMSNLAKKAVENAVNQFRNHSSFAGIMVTDEPRVTEDFAPAFQAVAATGYHAHLNLFPYFVDGVNNYQGYVEDAVISLGVENMDYLQFDQYPFKLNNNTSNLFHNMNIIREAGLKYDLDTAFYVQSMGIQGVYREPTGDEIRYHVNTGLAYGFKYLTYFTWMAAHDGTEIFTYAILDDLGRTTEMYEPVCRINAKVHGVGELLAKLDALKVTLTNGKEQGIETADAAAAALHPKGKSEFIISYMEQRGNTQEYVMVVNNSFRKEVTETFTVSKNVTALTDCTTGTETPVDISSGEITLTLAAGDFMLFKLGEGDDFVQVEVDEDAQNLAKNKPVAVEKTYTNAFEDSGSYAYCLTDGLKGSTRKTAKGWHCQSATADIDIDLKRAVTINRVDVYPFGYSRLADYGKLFPRDFDVQVSVDGETWTTVASVTGFDEKKDGIPSLKFAPVEARYVRIHVTKGVKNAFEIAEIEIYNDDGSIPAVKDVHQ